MGSGAGAGGVHLESNHGGTSTKGKEGDPRGSSQHVEKMINKSDEEFSKTDIKLGGSGDTRGRGGYDPMTH